MFMRSPNQHALYFVIVGALLSSVVLSHEPLKRCGASLSKDLIASLSTQMRRSIRSHRNLVVSASTPNLGPIQVVWHVMMTSASIGSLSDNVIMQNVALLQTKIGQAAGMTFAFNATINIRRRYIDSMHFLVPDASVQDENEQISLSIKNTLQAVREGDGSTLNIVSANLHGWKAVGIAGFPWDYLSYPGVDAVFVDYRAMAGHSSYNSDFQSFNLGYTLVHEVGHWLGLWHTFEGGCSSTGDEVFDTPAQLIETLGCPADNTEDTCPSQPGFDPIHNFMNYANDECMNQLSAGQIERIRYWSNYRLQLQGTTTELPNNDIPNSYDTTQAPSPSPKGPKPTPKATDPLKDDSSQSIATILGISNFLVVVLLLPYCCPHI